MKTVKIISLLVAVLFASSNLYAGTVYSSGARLTLKDVDDKEQVIGLSPLVEANYVSGDGEGGGGTTKATTQWYAAAAGHPGGNKAYGTSQDLNNVYTKNYSTTSALSNVLTSIPTESQSDSAWTGAQWEL